VRGAFAKLPGVNDCPQYRFSFARQHMNPIVMPQLPFSSRK
jgi:hypothetical protein